MTFMRSPLIDVSAMREHGTARPYPCFHNTALPQDARGSVLARDTGNFTPGVHASHHTDILFGGSGSSPEHVPAFSRIVIAIGNSIVEPGDVMMAT
jgi:hypothetical protein